MRVSGLAAALAVLLSCMPGFVLGKVLLPSGIAIRMTIAGPVFVDAQGKSLYQRDDGWSCTDHPDTVRQLSTVIYNQTDDFPMQVPDPASHRSCAEKYPPLFAPDGAKPIGDWSLVQPEKAGLQQWAYKGKPVYRSTKDRESGDIHGWMPAMTILQMTAWQIIAAPLEAPPGIETRVTSLGLALTNQSGKTLYISSSVKALASSENWKPVLAPAAATATHLPAGWSIADYKGGLHQWAWKGNPLYTYALDAGDQQAEDHMDAQFVDIFGELYGRPVEGWKVALLVPASAPPAGVRIGSVTPQYLGADKVYTDGRGKTLYAIHCHEFTEDGLDCDDVGDSPRYWTTFCGGEERCRKDWQPLAAPRNARSIDGLWSVALINPSHPFKPLKEGEQGIPVWTYRGRLVFTFAGDQKPGDVYGEFDFFSTMMSAVRIEAFGIT